jgi:hypothetical protein
LGLDWTGIWPGIRIGRYEREGWLLDYTLATYRFDVACLLGRWTEGSDGEGLSVMCVLAERVGVREWAKKRETGDVLLGGGADERKGERRRGSALI